MIIIFRNLVKFPARALAATRRSWVAMGAVAMAALTLLVAPVASLATETETETKVHEIATSVGTEGVAIVLAILSALVALLVAVIIIPKAVALIRRFI